MVGEAHNSVVYLEVPLFLFGTGMQKLVEAQRNETYEPGQISIDMELASEGGEGPDMTATANAIRVGDIDGDTEWARMGGHVA